VFSPVTAKELKEAVVQFYFYKQGTCGSFFTCIFDAFLRANPNNFQKLGQGFPAHALAVASWREARSESEFFESFGVILFNETEKRHG